jgi:hypothetical protein
MEFIGKVKEKNEVGMHFFAIVGQTLFVIL